MLTKLYSVTCDTDYVCGDNITYLDFMYHEMLDVLSWMSDGAVLEEFPSLKGYCERMVGHYNPEYWQENQQMQVNGANCKINKAM